MNLQAAHLDGKSLLTDLSLGITQLLQAIQITALELVQ